MDGDGVEPFFISTELFNKEVNFMKKKEMLWENVIFNTPNIAKFNQNIQNIKEKNKKYAQTIRKTRKNNAFKFPITLT